MCPTAGIAEEVVASAEDTMVEEVVDGEDVVIEEQSYTDDVIVEELGEVDQIAPAESAITVQDDSAEPVTYLAWGATEKKLVEKTGDDARKDYTVVSDQTARSAGWYVVSEDVTISERITVTGTANLILCDDATLTASAGISVTSGNTLNIYGQSAGSGKLTAISEEDACTAAIGGDNEIKGGVSDCGTITVHGGTVEAIGDDYLGGGAGIGGGLGDATGGNGGIVTIYGGGVKAAGSDYAAGIGGSIDGNGGTVKIYGGTVEADGGADAAAIGGGNGGGSGSITIYGGTVIAHGNADGGDEEYDIIPPAGAGIGAGTDGINGETDTIVINGGTVTATVPTNRDGAAIGNGGGDGNDVSVTIGATATVLAGPNSDGTGTETKTGAANNKSYKYVHITYAAHTHDFTFSASGATITASCADADCPLTSNPTLAIVAPAKTTYGDANGAEATLSELDGFNVIAGLSISPSGSIRYYRATKSGSTYTKGSELAAAPTDAGDYLAELTLSGVKTDAGDNEEVSASIGYTIAQRDAELSWTNTSFTYDGKSHVPTAMVSNLVSGAACTVTVTGAQTNAGTYTATAAELSNANYLLPAKATQQFTINQASIARAKVTLATTSYTCNGKARKPAVKSVVLSGKTLKSGTDYAVAYTSNVNPGTATVTITGKGNYTDAAKVSFAIKLAKASAPATVVKLTKSSAKATWDAVTGAKSYQLQWRKAGGKWATKSAKGTSLAVTGLAKNACYEFRVRAVAGSVKGAWSKASYRWIKGVSAVKVSSGTTKGSVKVTWKANKAATGGFKVFVYTKKGGKAIKTVKVSKGKSAATVKGLKSGTKYYVRVCPAKVKSGTTYTGAMSGYYVANAAK